jgi:hypothetical protein
MLYFYYMGQHSTGKLFLKSLEPSSLEGILVVCFGFLAAAFNVVILLVRTGGGALPSYFGGTWATEYSRAIARPLSNLLASHAFNNLVLIALWGIVGLLVYSLIEAAIRGAKSWNETETNIQYTHENVIQHPMRGTFLKVVMWRIGVVVAAIVLLVIIRLAAPSFLLPTGLVLGHLSLAASITAIVAAIVAWTIIAHLAVVLIRLFLLRTRVFS